MRLETSGEAGEPPENRPWRLGKIYRGDGFGDGLANVPAYERQRDLPRLVPLWPHEIRDGSRAGRLRVLSHLSRAMQAERRRAMAGKTDYDLNRHLALFRALKREREDFARFGIWPSRNWPSRIGARAQGRALRPRRGLPPALAGRRNTP